ncbi:MAG: hypothetical protein DKINENOH_00487 [bacterium]|nr:hypothetical protein [bacterium]
MNYAIFLAIFAQSLIAKTNRMAGAIAGYAITAGVLVWGISAYADGSAITFLTIRVSKTLFIIACLVWFLIDTGEFLQAREMQRLAAASSLEKPSVGKEVE